MIIREQIRQARCSYIPRAGANPTSIYLGRKEMRILKDWASENCHFLTESNEGECRAKVDGLFVYVVDADSHFRLA